MGVKATAAGQQKLKEAKADKRNYEGKKYRYSDIALDAGCDEKSVQRFFNLKNGVSYEMASAICRTLDLDVDKIIESSKAPSSSSYNWRKICRDMFADQQQRFRTRRGLLNPDRELSVFVPLGLVKPKSKKQKKSPMPGFDSSQGMRQYEVAKEEIEKTFEHESFLSEIVHASSNSVVLVGEPGAGKSTWMEKIGEALLGQPDSPLPIFISLSLLNGQSLKDYLLEIWLDEALGLQGLELTGTIIKDFEQQFHQQNFCLLLDGLDEMRSESPARDIGDSLQGMLRNIRVFISCRLNVWEVVGHQAFPTFDIFRSLAFSDDQIDDFVRQWHRNEPEQSNSLIRLLREDRASRLRDLVKNPLRLVMLCNIWDEDQELPQTKADLYSEFVGFVYERERGRNKFSISDVAEEKLNEALGELAKRMIDEEKILDQSFVVKLLDNQLELAKKLGWLNIIGKSKGKNVYAFYHLTFAEYFAALSIDDWGYFLPKKESEYKKYQNKHRIFHKSHSEVIKFWIEFPDKLEKWNFFQAILNFHSQTKLENSDNIDFYRLRLLLESIDLFLVYYQVSNKNKSAIKSETEELVLDIAKLQCESTANTLGLKLILDKFDYDNFWIKVSIYKQKFVLTALRNYWIKSCEYNPNNFNKNSFISIIKTIDPSFDPKKNPEDKYIQKKLSKFDVRKLSDLDSKSIDKEIDDFLNLCYLISRIENLKQRLVESLLSLFQYLIESYQKSIKKINVLRRIIDIDKSNQNLNDDLISFLSADDLDDVSLIGVCEHLIKVGYRDQKISDCLKSLRNSNVEHIKSQSLYLSYVFSNLQDTQIVEHLIQNALQESESPKLCLRILEQLSSLKNVKPLSKESEVSLISLLDKSNRYDTQDDLLLIYRLALTCLNFDIEKNQAISSLQNLSRREDFVLKQYCLWHLKLFSEDDDITCVMSPFDDFVASSHLLTIQQVQDFAMRLNHVNSGIQFFDFNLTVGDLKYLLQKMRSFYHIEGETLDVHNRPIYSVKSMIDFTVPQIIWHLSKQMSYEDFYSVY